MLKLDIQRFALNGTGKIKREEHIIAMNVGTSEAPEIELIGKDNDELSRTLNNEVEAKKNVLGETTVEVTQAPQTTTVDPFNMRYESKIAEKLMNIYDNDLELDDVVEEFYDISKYDKIAEGKYKAFKQSGAIDLKSWGGQKSLGAPFDINWTGPKVHGTFDIKSKTFTETTTV